MALRKAALDAWLLAEQPIERGIQFLLALTVPRSSSGPSEEVAVAASSCCAVAIPGSSPRTWLGGGIDEAGEDHRQDQGGQASGA